MIPLLSAAISVALWPATAAHEATHYAVARPWATLEAADWRPGSAALVWEFRDTAPQWVVSAAALAPTIVGVCAALLVLGFAAEGAVRFVVYNEGVAVLLAGYWLFYTLPSMGDLTAATPGVEP